LLINDLSNNIKSPRTIINEAKRSNRMNNFNNVHVVPFEDNRDKKLNETLLIQLTGADISTVRRYFKDHLGMTPLAFHRKLRLGYARELLQSGQDQFTAALEIGYESSSGFRDAFLKEFGVIPSKNNAIG